MGILIKSERGLSYTEPDFNNPRVMGININIHGFKARVVIGYSPTNVNGSDAMKAEFYRNMKKACDTCPKHHKLLIAGDFNAETSLVYDKTEYDGTKVVSDEICNDNGQRLKSFTRFHKLCMPQTFFEKPIVNRLTWYSSDGKTKKIIDYVLLQRFINQYANDCEVNTDYEFESDHRLLVTSLSTPKDKRSRWKPKITHQPKPDLKLLSERPYKSDFVKSTVESLQKRVDGDNSALAITKRLTDSLTEAAEKILPEKTRKQITQIWKEDQDLNELLAKRAKEEKTSQEYKNITKSVKSRIRKLRNEKIRREADELNTFATKRDIEALYKSFKDDGSTFKRIRHKNECDPQKLREYFENHFRTREFQEDPIELIDAPEFIRNLKDISTEINNKPPDKAEIITTLKKLKNGKSSNDIPTIYLKSAVESNEIIDELIKLYDVIWLTEKVPQKWSHSRLVTIWKGAAKGKKEDPSSHRGIQIGSTFCKILVVIILERIRKWYEKQLLDQQQGFRSRRGTADGIYIVKRIQQVSHRSKKPIYALFVDLTAAFDHVNRDWLFQSINQRLHNKENDKLFKLLESVYSYTTTALSDHDSEIFDIMVGVRQGGPESPTLYNLYMDYVMRVFLIECKKQGVKFTKFKYKIPSAASTTDETASALGSYGEHTINWVGYADDIILTFDDETNLKKGLEILNNTFRRYQLSINASKTKTMIFNFDGPVEDYPQVICRLGGYDIENVKLFKYLGAIIHYKDASTGDAEINQRVDSAEAKYYEHAKKLMNFKILLRTRVQILNTLVRSRLTYGCQVWTLSTVQRNRLHSFYCGLLRKMIRGGFKRKDDSMAFKLTNENILGICDTESVIAFIDRQQKKFLAHVIRREDGSLIKQLTFNEDRNRIPGPYTTLRSAVLRREAPTDVNNFYKSARNKEI